MKSARLSLVLLILAALIAAAPASALCVKCISVECWAKIDATARDCSSYGTACATIGYCEGDGCGDFSCGPDQQTASLEPLNMQYVISNVRVERAKATPQAVARINAFAKGQGH